MKHTLELDLDDRALSSRRCLRCDSSDFRAIRFERFEELPAGRVPRESHIPMLLETLKHVRRCLNAAEPLPASEIETSIDQAEAGWGGYGSAESQTSVPLAICLGCSRIVSLV